MVLRFRGFKLAKGSVHRHAAPSKFNTHYWEDGSMGHRSKGLWHLYSDVPKRAKKGKAKLFFFDGH